MIKRNPIIALVSPTIIAAIIIAALGWGWNLEKRISKIESQNDIVQRVQNIENVLMPVLIEFRLREELKKRGIDEKILSKSEPESEVEMVKDIKASIESDVKSEF